VSRRTASSAPDTFTPVDDGYEFETHPARQTVLRCRRTTSRLRPSWGPARHRAHHCPRYLRRGLRQIARTVFRNRGTSPTGDGQTYCELPLVGDTRNAA